MTSIKKSILQLKEEDINEGNGNYELYKEYNDKILMDSLYVKNNIENFDNYDKMYNSKKRKVPNICNIEEEYKCKNILKDFNELKSINNNDIKNVDNKYKEEIDNNYVDYNKKYFELKENLKYIKYFNLFLCLLIILLIIIVITRSFW